MARPATALAGASRLLFNVQPCPSAPHSGQSRRHGPSVEGCTRQIRCLLECLHSTGHVWQGRFYPCPLDEPHLWQALRYIERNPVRAGLVADAERWEWSSARVHCGSAADQHLTMDLWQNRWSIAEWRAYLDSGDSEAGLAAIRQCTHSGRPLGETGFIRALERETHRSLMAQRRGRPRKETADERQGTLGFDA